MKKEGKNVCRLTLKTEIGYLAQKQKPYNQQQLRITYLPLHACDHRRF
jgi:hypothetical protein